MGDEWEEQRLERRESYQKSLRFRLDRATSEDLVGKRAVLDLLTSDLVSAVKLLRSSISLVLSDSRASHSETLRAAYARFSGVQALSDGERDIETALIEAQKISQAFGNAVSAIMTINRCVPCLTKARLEYGQVISSLHAQASMHAASTIGVDKTSMAAKEIIGQGLIAELHDGETIRLSVPPSSYLASLQSVSMESTLAQLAHWQAI